MENEAYDKAKRRMTNSFEAIRSQSDEISNLDEMDVNVVPSVGGRKSSGEHPDLPVVRERGDSMSAAPDNQNFPGLYT